VGVEVVTDHEIDSLSQVTPNFSISLYHHHSDPPSTLKLNLHPR
jgi:hypothetical protein